MERRTVLAGTLAILLGQTLLAQESSAGKPRNIKIHLKKFQFSPNHITLKQGEKVVFELTSSDFTHGFSLPDFNVRSDVPPGQVTLLALTPDKSGDFIFLCDNFCGDGHEEMHGLLTVLAA
ncbi:cytochrome c oxidase subunit 2 [Oxalobacteraceae bacterium GrIS 2.11]